MLSRTPSRSRVYAPASLFAGFTGFAAAVAKTAAKTVAQTVAEISAGILARVGAGRLAWRLIPVLLIAPVALVAPIHALADDPNPNLVEPQSQSAEEVLEHTTTRVLAVIDEARGYVDDDPERYYTAVHEVLDPVVDFRGFARGVMGEYATSARYRSLDEAGRDKLRDQLDRFTETIRVGLVRTYSKGLLAFGGSRVELEGSDEADTNDERATLRQLIYSDQSEPFVVIYQMARDRDGVWQMRNLVVENVNLGQVYRSQFESAARRYDGDLDKVIDNWSAETEQSG